MKYQLLLILSIIVIIFLSGCIIPSGQPTASNVGLSSTLTSDAKKAKTSVPVTFILTTKNLASESSTDISTELLNLTGWRIENALQDLDELLPSDLYKFSWIAYAPSTPNKTFIPVTNIFYSMQTVAGLKLRVYSNDYLNGLKAEDREKIRGQSALLSSNISKLTPVSVTVSLQQPFILTEYSQRFPFVIEIKNAGLGQPYSDDASYPPRESWKSYVRFSYTSNSTIDCDYDDGDLVKLVNGSKSIVCRLAATQDDVNKFSDFSVDFMISYTYLDKASMKIEII